MLNLFEISWRNIEIASRSGHNHCGNKTSRISNAINYTDRKVKHANAIHDQMVGKFVASACPSHWYQWYPEKPEEETSKVKLPPIA